MRFLFKGHRLQRNHEKIPIRSYEKKKITFKMRTLDAILMINNN